MVYIFIGSWSFPQGVASMKKKNKIMAQWLCPGNTQLYTESLDQQNLLWKKLRAQSWKLDGSFHERETAKHI